MAGNNNWRGDQEEWFTFCPKVGIDIGVVASCFGIPGRPSLPMEFQPTGSNKLTQAHFERIAVSTQLIFHLGQCQALAGFEKRQHLDSKFG